MASKTFPTTADHDRVARAWPKGYASDPQERIAVPAGADLRTLTPCGWLVFDVQRAVPLPVAPLPEGYAREMTRGDNT